MNTIEARRMIVEILEEKTSALNNAALSPKLRDPSGDVSLAELELDSLEQVDIAMDIEIRTGLNFDIAEIATSKTIGGLAAHIARRMDD